jgi:hypothetical protein
MRSKFFKKLYLFFIFLFILTFSLALNQFLFQHEKDDKEKKHNELYDRELNKLDSMNELAEYLDKTAVLNGVKVDTGEYVNLARNIIAQRFYHGYASYGMRNNWVAFLAGTFIWNDFFGIVIPDDILKYNGALCSQQTMVFGELLKIKGYEIRKVMLNGHFCNEVFYNNSWHFYDPDMEPVFPKDIQRPSIKDLIANKDLLHKVYKNKLDEVSINRIFSKHEEGDIDVFPAKKMAFFHYGTKVLSDWLWVLFLCLAVYFRKKASIIS